MIVTVFAALSVPLGLALRDIAYETTAINTVKSAPARTVLRFMTRAFLTCR